MRRPSYGRRAIVIGASRGIGLGLVKELVKRQWSVLGTLRSTESALELVQIASENPRVETDILDVTSLDTINNLRSKLTDQCFQLLFINSGISGPEHMDPMLASNDEILSLFLTNAIGLVRVARCLQDVVEDDEGVIAFMSSKLGSNSENIGGDDLYRASKAALNSLSLSFSHSLKDRRVTVLSIHPGWVRTDLGGPLAPLDVQASAQGIVDVLERKQGSMRHIFVDYNGHEIPW
jgi:NAD(P)-dependent dehydrogenase (short-subunit alcohol dehydrogenase family)